MQDFFKKRTSRFLEDLQRAKEKSKNHSIFRGMAFLLFIGMLYTYFQSQNIGYLAGALVAGAGFYALVIRHRRLQWKVNYYQILRDLNNQELKRLRLDLQDFDTGESFLEKDHPYQQDLDILGQSSLFQMINRCQIRESSQLLARWLSRPSDQGTILDRQEAVKELAARPEWNQHFMATVHLLLEEKEKRAPSVTHEDISEWTRTVTAIRSPQIWKGISWIFSGFFVMAGGLVIFDVVTYHILYLFLVLHAIVLGFGLKKLNRMIKGIDKSHYLISSYEKAIKLLERSEFTSKNLLALKNNLLDGAERASTSISKLSSLTNRIASRSNMLYALLDIPLLLDVHLVMDLHRWKLKHSGHIEKWFETVHELESLISLASFAHANPRFSFPEFQKGEFYFSAKGLGHPLIPEPEKITNDYSIDGKGKVDIITGSNMSGKSTFQRTVGINMVLAQAGAPVDASMLTMSTTFIFTSMRTRDNLSEHTSSFYAELKRIRQLLHELNEHESTFFLLDEILKGTNSQDRHLGAVALVQKLTRQKGFGMVSTHDLALAELEKTEAHVRNFSFNSTIEGDKIQFDYKLTPGPCRSFNASKLMEQMGIM